MTDPSTPMMEQYRRIKAELAPGIILFFRLGDFYEMFFEDAKEAAPDPRHRPDQAATACRCAACRTTPSTATSPS